MGQLNGEQLEYLFDNIRVQLGEPDFVIAAEAWLAYTTYSGLALMVLRRAAGLTVVPADRDKPAFVTAGSILQAAVAQRAAKLVGQVPQNVR